MTLIFFLNSGIFISSMTDSDRVKNSRHLRHPRLKKSDTQRSLKIRVIRVIRVWKIKTSASSVVKN